MSGGWGVVTSTWWDRWGSLTSTETLEKDGGSAWQLVASLPSARDAVRGVGLDTGRFMIIGECWTMWT